MINERRQIELGRHEREDRPGDQVVSFWQRRSHPLNNNSSGPTRHAVQFGWRLTGNLDGDLLRRSLQAIVARHEVFRTTFVESQKDTAPVVLDNATIQWKQEQVEEAELLESITGSFKEFSNPR